MYGNNFGSSTFGQPTFGQPATSTAPAFGASTFGGNPAFGQPSAPTTGGFGATSTFGATQPTTFGAPATTQTGFGAPSFGSTQPSTTFGQPSTGGFGSTPGFGSTTTPAFGATSTPAFGATTAPSTFGSTPSIFGSTTTSSTPFGGGLSSTTSTGSTMFGAPQTSAPSTGLFGASTAAASPFGGSTFGSTTSTAPSFGFGGASATAPSFGMGATTQGTGNPPYKTTPETDQSTGSVFQQTAITAMPQYTTKSFEELRWEDYQAKKHQTGGGFGGASFSTPSTFGGATSAPSSSLFGSATTASPFGATSAATPSFGGFGAPSTATAPTTSVFGASTSTPSVFGASTTPFGATSTATPAFGAASSTPSLFGAASTPSPFGAPASTAPTATSGFGFGATATTASPFGSAPNTTPAFGSATTGAAPSSFSFGGLGSTSAPNTAATPSFSFGGATAQPAATGATTNLFGSTATTAPTTSLFGASTLFPSSTASAPSTAPSASFSLPSFGASSTASTTPSLFPSLGATSTASPSTSFLSTPSLGAWSTPSSTQPTGSSLFSPVGTTTPGQVKQATLTSQPFGPMPSITVSPATSSTSSTGTPTTPQVKKTVSTPSHYKLTPRSAAKIKPRGYNKSKLPIFEDTSQSTGTTPTVSTPDLFTPRSSIKKLVIDTTEDDDYYEPATSTPAAATPVSRQMDRNMTPLSPRAQDALSPMSTGSLYPKLPEAARSPERITTAYSRTSNLPNLTKPGYYTIPDISEMDAASLRAVPNFLVGCEGVGTVEFVDPTDVRGLDLDKIVEFKHREVTIYPDDHNKPRVGEGLNKPAIVTLEKVWPIDKASKQIKVDRLSLEKYRQKLEKTTENYGARYLGYDAKTGSWTFQVEHFSRYGIDDEDDDEEGTSTPFVEEVPNTSISEVPPPVETMASPNRFAVDADLDDEQDYYRDEYDTQYPGIDATYEVDEYLPQTETGMAMDIPEPVLPKQLGLNTAKMQVMKSLLFEPTEPAEEEYKFYNPLVTRPAEPETPLTFSPATPTSDIASTSMLSPLSTSVLFSSTPFQKTATANLKKVILADSVTNNRSKHLNDAALFMGRSFRIGWTHSGKYVRLGGSKAATSFSVVTVEQLFVPTSGEVNNRSQYLPLLEMHRSSSSQTVDINVGPGMKFEQGTDNIQSFGIVDTNEAIKKHTLGLEAILSSTSNVFVKNLLQNAVLLFELVHALWGDESSAKSIVSMHAIKNQEQPDSIQDEYKENLARRTALSEWLKKAIKNTNMPTDNHAKIFQLLTSKRILEAAALAQQIGDFRLSTLIAQSNSLIKEDLQNQLAVWDKCAETSFIDNPLLRIYQLLAGKMSTEVLRGLDWKRCFGVYLWFGCGRTNNIAEVLEQYDKSLLLQDASYPLPEWLEGVADERPSTVAVLEDQSILAFQDPKQKVFQQMDSTPWRPAVGGITKSRLLSVAPIMPDTNYHLLRLYSDRSYGTWKVLAPSSWTPYALDSRISWHLFTILTQLGYPCPRMMYSLFADYALQLEISGLWTWAVYVWLNLPYQSPDTFRIRNDAIKDIIARHSWNMTREDEAFLQNMKIPQKWIHAARSWVACFKNDTENQIIFLIRSQQWVEAHKLIVDIVAPEIIAKTVSLSANFGGVHIDSLLDLLQQLAPHASEVVDWNIGGSIYLDFVKLTNQYKILLQQSQLNVKNAKLLEQQCLFVAERLASLANKTQQRTDSSNETLSQRIAVSDMSTHTTEMLIGIRGLLSREVETTPTSQLDTNSMKNMLQIFDIMKTLPIPDDFYHKLMRNVTETFVI